MFKEHKEFHAINLEEGWVSPPGYPSDIQEKILSGQLDEGNGKGTRTRLLRFLPGASTDDPFIHDYFEEVYLISGDLTVGKGDNREVFTPNTYACRPPQTYHGPFSSETGCVLLEIHFYE